ncbi:MAG: hydroxysqualene dehydroxylase HpnE [Planctomycetales bacterium]|nr:hydroxysqualene dehydroxylase HpnE [Planctomycetales bacterium]
MTRPLEPQINSSARSAIVVGGGLAGISAALALAKHGTRVTILEGRSRLGGRTGSFTVELPQSGEQACVDYCQHVGMGCCTNLKQLIGWLDQEDDWQTHRQLHFFGPTGVYQELKACPLLPAPLHLSGWLLKWPGLSLRDRVSIARGLLAIGKLRLNPATQAQTALDWLQHHGQTTRGIKHFWATIVVSALGEELSRVSLAAVAKVLQDGFLRHRDAFHLLIPSQPLGELLGTRAAEQLRAHRVELHLSSRVSSIDYSSEKAIYVTCQQQSFIADSLVLAVPWHQLGKIDYGSDAAGLAQVANSCGQLQSSAITGIHTWWDRRWFELPHAAIVGRLCQWVFPKRNWIQTSAIPETASASQDVLSSKSAARAEHYYQIVISATASWRGGQADDVAEQIQRDLGEVFPAVRDARLMRYQVVTDPQSVFSISPESYARRPEPHVTPRLMLAGDWTATGWPATMEGAVISGFRAAEELLRLNSSQLNPSPTPSIVRPPLEH